VVIECVADPSVINPGTRTVCSGRLLCLCLLLLRPLFLPNVTCSGCLWHLHHEQMLEMDKTMVPRVVAEVRMGLSTTADLARRGRIVRRKAAMARILGRVLTRS
jgi:hypothetical protein